MNTFAVVHIFLLGVALLAGLLIVPLGLPGLWIMLGAGLLYWIVLPSGGIGLLTFSVAAAMVIVAEVLEFTIAGNYTRKYGGSRRAAWGAILGGIVGAVVGVPIPILGSLVGAFVGTFAGAFVGEWTAQRNARTRATTNIASERASTPSDTLRSDTTHNDTVRSNTSAAHRSATRAATGALLGRAVAAAVKSGLGVLVAIVFLLADILGRA